MRRGRLIKAIGRAALAPFEHGLGADAVALRQHTGGLGGSGDLGADGRGGPGIGMDLHHGLPPTKGTSGEALEAVGVVYDRQPHRIPTMLRNQTTRSRMALNSIPVRCGPDGNTVLPNRSYRQHEVMA